MDIKLIGSILKAVWNLFLAGKTINVKGVPVTLPPLEAQVPVPNVPPITLVSAVTSTDHRVV